MNVKLIFSQETTRGRARINKPATVPIGIRLDVAGRPLCRECDRGPGDSMLRYDGAENLTLPMNECYKIIDYILRGDAGKEKK